MGPPPKKEQGAIVLGAETRHAAASSVNAYIARPFT
jgi:hypothetical protein